MKMLPWQLAEIKYAFYIYFFIILVNIYLFQVSFFMVLVLRTITTNYNIDDDNKDKLLKSS